jgi:hypothetical protein
MKIMKEIFYADALWNISELYNVPANCVGLFETGICT